MTTIKYSREAKRGILRALKAGLPYLRHPGNKRAACDTSMYICFAMVTGQQQQQSTSVYGKKGHATPGDVNMARDMVMERLGIRHGTYDSWLEDNHPALYKKAGGNCQEGRRQWLEAMIVEFANPVYPRKK